MSDYFDRVERQIVQRRGGRRAAHRRACQARVRAPGVAAAVARGDRGRARVPARARRRPSQPTPAPAAGPRASPSRSTAVGDRRGVAARAARSTVRSRSCARAWARSFPVSRVSRAGRDRRHVSNRSRRARARILALAAPRALAFYDWEANAITPNGKTVASQLQAQTPTALRSARARGRRRRAILERDACHLTRRSPWPPGNPCPRGRSWCRRLDCERAIRPAPRTRRLGSSCCATPRRSRAATSRILTRSHSRGRRRRHVRVHRQRAGREFQALTAAIARRGSLVSGLGQTLNQHFAIALDNRLITVPFIDYKQYPDGINGDNGADIGGSLTRQSAKDLAICSATGRSRSASRQRGERVQHDRGGQTHAIHTTQTILRRGPIRAIRSATAR